MTNDNQLKRLQIILGLCILLSIVSVVMASIVMVRDDTSGWRVRSAVDGEGVLSSEIVRTGDVAITGNLNVAGVTVADSVSAREIVLTDNRGKMCARLRVTNGAGELVLRDGSVEGNDNGHRLTAGKGSGSFQLSVLDGYGKTICIMHAKEGARGQPGVGFVGIHGKRGTEFGHVVHMTNDPGHGAVPQVMLTDWDGEKRKTRGTGFTPQWSLEKLRELLIVP